jgi:hypothetical protein
MLTRLGDVSFLDAQLGVETRSILFGALRLGFAIAGEERHRRRVLQALERFLHALRRQHAAVVVLEDRLRMQPE